MSGTWKRWEGRVVDGKFLLQSYLGGSDHSAVFLTPMQGGADDSEKAAIKLVSATADADRQLSRWEAGRDLNHPNLIRIVEAGRCEIDGTKLLYVVEEYAEENLSQILPERALTAEEVRGMLPPILRALQFVHNKGLVHGHIRPSNILAIEDQVKLSSDTLVAPRETSRSEETANAYDPPEASMGGSSTASDVWQLGMTLTEVLTQRLPVWDRARRGVPEVPAAVPEPFREIAGHCLQMDPGARWTLAQISHRLDPVWPVPVPVQSSQRARMVSPAATRQPRKSAKWIYVVGLAVLLATAYVLFVRTKSSVPAAGTQPMQAPSTAIADRSQSAHAPTGQEITPTPAATGDATKNSSVNKASTSIDTTSSDPQVGVLQRVMPEVSPSARRTIHGKIMVGVRVKVDSAGDVQTARIESGNVSKYFSRIALEAARNWKFSPAEAGETDDREWKVKFGFSRARTEASATRVKS
jgi:TonB family protein